MSALARTAALLALLAAPLARAKRSATPIANPHQSGAAVACAPPAVDRESIMVAPLATQTDTLLRIEVVEVNGLDVPIYSFKQPARLSTLELPFKVLPVARINAANIVALRVDEQHALDSWFPGYKWDVLVDVSCNSHVGWRFSPVDGTGDAFFALIVKTKDEDLLSVASSFAEALRAKLSVGVPAAPWMLALLAAQSPAKLSL